MAGVTLGITVKREAWRMDDPATGDADREFDTVKSRVLWNFADGRCAACGFETRVVPEAGRSGWFEFHHLNHDHSDNRPENLALLCPFCHAYFHVGFAGMTGRAYLASARGVSAEGLNYICHLLHAAKAARDGRLREIAARVEGWLRDGAAWLEAAWPECASATDLANALLRAEGEDEQAIRAKLRKFSVKLVPNLDAPDYGKPIAFWNAHVAKSQLIDLANADMAPTAPARQRLRGAP